MVVDFAKTSDEGLMQAMTVVIVADIVWTSDEGQQYWDRGGVLRRGKTKREEVSWQLSKIEVGRMEIKKKSEVYFFIL